MKSLLKNIGPGAAVACLGDNSPDEDAFAALHYLAFDILVPKKIRRTLADTWINPPDELADFLSAWIAACKPPR